MDNFDPNATGTKDSGIFALPQGLAESQLVLIPVPWDVTTSFGRGTSIGPEAIRTSSHQMDLCDPVFGDFYKKGIHMLPTPSHWLEENQRLGTLAQEIQRQLTNGKPLSTKQKKDLQVINEASRALNAWLEQESQGCLDQEKIPCVVGGDHSSPYGLISALSKKYKNLSILHIDAHCDLRKSYQGFHHSHASIMWNVMETLPIHSLVQVGIRDFCPEERDLAARRENIFTFYDKEVRQKMHFGKTWGNWCTDFSKHLSKYVYVSFDIDGLSPDLCPHTGTPVPGGLNFNEAGTLLSTLKSQGLKVVGFDLCEVAPANGLLEGWDGNVGARILYQLCGAVLGEMG